VTEEHRGEGEGDGAEPVAEADHQRPPLAHRRTQEAQEQHHQQDREDATLDERQGLHRRGWVWRARARRVEGGREQQVDGHPDQGSARRLVGVVVPVVERLVARVLVVPVDPGRTILDQRPHEVVAAVLVPGRHLPEEAVAEQERQRQDDLAASPSIDTGPPAAEPRVSSRGRLHGAVGQRRQIGGVVRPGRLVIARPHWWPRRSATLHRVAQSAGDPDDVTGLTMQRWHMRPSLTVRSAGGHSQSKARLP
jgi:hypothetical protein